MSARNLIAVGSGKGGVGKSTVALNVALALGDSGAHVGVLDADLFGPNIPRMVNITRAESVRSWELARNPDFGSRRIAPLERFGLKIISSALVIGEDHPLTIASSFADMIVRQFFHDVEWGALDYLIVDLPPGTADLHQTLVERFPLTGAIVVVTPEDVAHLDGRKAVEMFRRAGVRVIGGVENMAGLECPHCKEHIDLLPEVAEDRSIWARGVERLARIPFDLSIARGGQSGFPLMISDPESDVASEFRKIAKLLG